MGIPGLILGLDKEIKGLICPHCGAHRANWEEVFKGEPCCEEEKKHRVDLDELCELIP